MTVTLPLGQMSTVDKLEVMEHIWSDLTRTPEDIPSPSWHAEVLQAREQRIADGTSRFLSIEEAKKAVRERLA